MARIVEALAPGRLGHEFRWLLASSWVSNLGDGIAIAAGPLLVASQTRNPLLVASAVLLQRLPWLIFGLHAGALVDRLDRRAIVVTTDLLRAGVLALLTLSILTDTVSIAIVLAALFIVGTAEVFADNASATLLPMLVPRADLAIGNARLQTGFLTVNQLAGPPIGAALFAAGALWPFLAQAVMVAMGALLVSRVVLASRVGEPVADRHVGQDIAEGFRWVRHNAAVRTLVLTIFIFNITFGAAWSVLVLYATERLGMGEVGFGLLTTVSAIGGLLGGGTYGWITRHLRLGDLMRIGLLVETVTHLALALTTRPAVAMVIFFVFGVHAFIWNTTSITVRQRAVPTELQGRVGSVNSIGTYGGLVVGSAFGGLIAQLWGVTAPFWFAFVGSGVFVVAIWRQLAHIAHGDEAGDEEQPLAGGNATDGVVRVGNTVRRPWKPTTDAAHAVLQHLEMVGFDHAPRVLGVDAAGREILSFAPGETIWPNHPTLLHDDAGLARGARLVADFHAAVASLAPLPPDIGWWPGVRDPAGGDLVLHGDLAPWNIVVDGDRWTIIDWDGVAPGRAAWELAYVLHTFVPLWPDSPFDDADTARRIAVFAEAYGAGAPLIEEALSLVPARTRALAAATAAGAQAGDPALARLHADGHTQLWLDAADHVERRMAAWQRGGSTRSA